MGNQVWGLLAWCGALLSLAGMQPTARCMGEEIEAGERRIWGRNQRRRGGKMRRGPSAEPAACPVSPSPPLHHLATSAEPALAAPGLDAAALLRVRAPPSGTSKNSIRTRALQVTKSRLRRAVDGGARADGGAGAGSCRRSGALGEKRTGGRGRDERLSFIFSAREPAQKRCNKWHGG